MIIKSKSMLLIALLTSEQALAAETLEQAFAEAIQQNQRIYAARANTQAADQQLLAAQGQRMPQLNVRGGYTQLSETPAAQTVVAGQDQVAQFPVSQAGSANAEAIVSIPIFTSGRISHSIDAAAAGKLAAEYNENTTALNIKIQVGDAFISIFRLQKALEVAQSHVISLRAHANDVQNLYHQGMVARNDLLASEVSLNNAEQNVLQYENSLSIAKARFNQLLNRDLNTEVDLQEVFPDIPAGDLASLSEQAILKRPELKALGEQIHATESQAASTKASLWPQVNVNGGYQYQQNRYQVYEGMWMANANMEWKIYDGSTSHRSDALTHQAIALTAQRNDLVNAISLQVRQAWLDLQETKKRIQVTHKATAQADENLKVSSERYQQGLASNTEVLEAEQLRLTSYNNFYNARYDEAMANLNLRRALGIL